MQVACFLSSASFFALLVSYFFAILLTAVVLKIAGPGKENKKDIHTKIQCCR